ncbi:MAG TPA: phage holin family protein [Pseudomonadota bacterium]|nr:phage holin family protein [Pseudomonadota bacterium]
MAIISALLSMLSRKIGDLLQLLFGWSISGLFGRLSSRKQNGLSVALILSIVWPLLVLGCFLPSVAAWAVAFIPLHDWIGEETLRIVWIALAVVIPMIVGGLTAWIVPSRKQRGSVLRTIFSGYPLTLGMFLSFLITFLVVPVLKLVSMARRWEDEHVFIQPREGAYDEVLQGLAAACDKAHIEVQIKPVPKVMQAPTRVLKWFGRSALDPIIASNPRMLAGKGVQLYLYPADLLIRATPELKSRVRAAIVREMMSAPAHLTEDAKAQQLEEHLNKLWHELARQPVAGPHPRVQNQLPALAKIINDSKIPYGDWMLLYTNITNLERAAAGESALADRDLVPAAQESSAMERDPRSEVSTVDLIKEAFEESQALIKAEVALARHEALKEVVALKRFAIAAGISAVVAILGVAMLLVAAVLAAGAQALVAAIVGGALLVLAGGTVGIGYSMLPKKPVPQTQENIKEDVRLLKERLA